MSVESDLIKAFRYAIDGEKRFGIREDCREDLEERWSRVIFLIGRLMSEVKAKKK